MLKWLGKQFGGTIRASQVIDALGSLAEQLGYPKLILVFWGFLVIAWGWIAQALPYWAIFLGVVALAVAVIWAAKLIIVAKTSLSLSFDKSRVSELGSRLRKLSREISRFAIDLNKDSLLALSQSQKSDEDNSIPSHTEWRKGNLLRELNTSRFLEMFGGEVHAVMVLLKKLEIEAPHHLLSIYSERDLQAAASYFGLVGTLLEEGNLTEAKSLTRDDFFDLLRG